MIIIIYKACRKCRKFRRHVADEDNFQLRNVPSGNTFTTFRRNALIDPEIRYSKSNGSKDPRQICIKIK